VNDIKKLNHNTYSYKMLNATLRTSFKPHITSVYTAILQVTYWEMYCRHVAIGCGWQRLDCSML